MVCIRDMLFNEDMSGGERGDWAREDADFRALYRELFKERMYVRHYSDSLTGGETPFEHFLRKGRFIGNYPHKGFDPIVYRLKEKLAASECRDPYGHFLKHNRDAEANRYSTEKLIVLLDGIVPERSPCHNPKDIKLDEYDAISPSQSKRFSESDTLKISWRDHAYELISPDAGSFMDMLARKEPFCFYKRPHGLWDVVRTLERVMERIAEHDAAAYLNSHEVFTAAVRICRLYCNNRVLHQKHKGLYAENYLYEIISDFYRRCGGMKELLGVAFKGYPTLDSRVFSFPDVDEAMGSRIRLFHEFHADSETELTDGTIIKRYLVSGGFRKLPTILRGYNVAIVGPPWFSDFGNRLQLPRYKHLRIHFKNSMHFRKKILKQCKEYINRTRRQPENRDKPVVILFQCGGSLASWVILRLCESFDDVTLIDMGQALAGWHLDEYFYSFMPWVRIFKKSIVQNMGLERYYQKIAGPAYEQWLQL